MNHKAAWTPEALIHDGFVLAAAFCFISGFIPFAPEKFYVLAASKPVIHRGFLTVFTVSALLWAAARNELCRKQSLEDTPLTAFLKNCQPRPSALLTAFFLFPALLWSYASLVRYEAFQAGFDMAIFSQAIWNTLHGSPLYSSIKGGICLLGDHFSPLLFIFAAAFRLWPDPRFLLILQGTLAASAVFPLYRIGKNKFGPTAWALVPVFALVCYLPLRNAVRFEFHPEVAAIPLMLWACYFWDRAKMFPCSVMLLLTLASKENASLAVFMFGLFALLKRRPIFGIFWMVFSAVYFWTVIYRIIPALSGQPYFYLSGNFLSWQDQGIAAFAKHIFRPATAAYLVKIFLPLGFLPLGSLAILPALPALAQNVTSRNEATLSIFYQYTAFLTPFLFYSLAETLKKLHPRHSSVLIYLIFWTVLMAGVSDFYVASRASKQITPHLRELPALLRQVPADASVRTHEFLAAHLANRRELHVYENNHPSEGGSAQALDSDYVVLDRVFLGTHDITGEDWFSRYRPVFEKDGFMIFRNKRLPS